ncbi:MAG: NAD(P)H-dependent oxidoreductase [Pirellulaceae bacterium]|nr:NAD(P)H-dependent oxidoreductase [Pirellulaceae bacterium]
MPDLTPSALQERLTWRYAVKQFDAERKIPLDIWQVIEQALILTPSSFGLQPWQFVIVTDPQIKQQMPPRSWHQTQPLHCSHMVVLTARKSLDEAYVDRFLESVAQTRGVATETLSGYRNVIRQSVAQSTGQHLNWNARQVYIALGQLMTAAAMVGVDSCPMEGLDMAAYDQLLGLTDSPYTTVVGCALGYRSPSDKYASAPKVRFAAADIIKHI